MARTSDNSIVEVQQVCTAKHTGGHVVSGGFCNVRSGGER